VLLRSHTHTQTGAHPLWQLCTKKTHTQTCPQTHTHANTHTHTHCLSWSTSQTVCVCVISDVCVCACVVFQMCVFQSYLSRCPDWVSVFGYSQGFSRIRLLPLPLGLLLFLA